MARVGAASDGCPLRAAMSDEGTMSKGLWVKLSVAFFDDDRLLLVGAESELLFVRGLAWAKRDGSGFISRGAMVRLGLGLDDPIQAALRLSEVGLWVAVDSGYRISAWDEWQADSEVLTRRAEAGSLGNHRRWHQDRPSDTCRYCAEASLVIAQSSQVRSVCDEFAIPEIEIEKDIYKDIAQPALSETAPKVNKSGLFDAFWGVYPRRVGKGAAAKAHARAIKRATPERILDGAQAVADRWRTLAPDERQYVPHPATWLNADRWDDEAEPVAGAPAVVKAAWSADVECSTCHGDGWESYEDERGAYMVRPCVCRVKS